MKEWRKLRLRETKQLSYGYTASKWSDYLWNEMNEIRLGAGMEIDTVGADAINSRDCVQLERAMHRLTPRSKRG